MFIKYSFSAVQGQGNITRTIGFNQLRTTVTESGSGVIDISLAPNAVSSNIIGRVVPLRVDQFESYMANLSRNVPEVIQQAIDSITDPAECKLSSSQHSLFGSISLAEFSYLGESLHMFRKTSEL